MENKKDTSRKKSPLIYLLAVVFFPLTITYLILKSKNWLWITAGIIGFSLLLFFISGAGVKPPKEEVVKQQREDFLKIYKEMKDTVYHSRKSFYYANNLINKVPSSELYGLFKDTEEYHKTCSAHYFAFAEVPSSLKPYKKDIKASFGEIANACTYIQEYSKHTADYINTGSLESTRKAEQQLEAEPFKIMANGVSMLVYKVGGEIGLDTEKLNEEFKDMSDRIRTEFESETGLAAP